MTQKQRIIVTSALPYANGPIHAGHLVEYIQTDIYVRFLKLIGEDAVYCCADDTHGTPIELKAKEQGIAPEELIAKVYAEHKAAFDKFLVQFDSFYSTNSPENKHFSDIIFHRLKDAGFIYTKDVEGTYCEFDKRSLPDRYVKGTCPKCNAPDQYGDVCEKCNAAYKTVDLIDPYCVLCKNTPIRKMSNHYFFKLSAFSNQLREWLTTNLNLQPEVKNFALNWIENGLEDWNISRDGPYFGFKIPGESDKYYYVWLDAPIGYIASYAHLIGNTEKAEAQWRDSQTIHFIGKDIMYFHLLFWPAMLIGSGFAPPTSVNVHGFLTVNGEKMSKSRGTFYTAEEFATKANPEHVRYYYASMLSRKLSDLNLDFSLLNEKINTELLANVGNFSYRVMSFVNKHFDSEVGDMASEELLMQEILRKSSLVREAYSTLNFNEALREILAISDIGNQYFQKNEPWKKIKEDKENVRRVCCLALNIIRNLSIMLTPILPQFSQKMQSQLNISALAWNTIGFTLTNHRINNAQMLLTKIEEQKQPQFPLDLRVARIDSIAPHPDAEKLYVLQIDLGTEKRQLVAGLRAHYSSEELQGKTIIIVANLKPAKLRGQLSQGMLLAADDGTIVRVLSTTASPGTSVLPEGYAVNTSQIQIDEVLNAKMTIQGGSATYLSKKLLANGLDVGTPDVSDGAQIR